jgi:hypothetical protein
MCAAAVTAEMTQAVVEAEAGAFPHPESRVAVFTCEVPDGWWGGGRIISQVDAGACPWSLRAIGPRAFSTGGAAATWPSTCHSELAHQLAAAG